VLIAIASCRPNAGCSRRIFSRIERMFLLTAPRATFRANRGCACTPARSRGSGELLPDHLDLDAQAFGASEVIHSIGLIKLRMQVVESPAILGIAPWYRSTGPRRRYRAQFLNPRTRHDSPCAHWPHFLRPLRLGRVRGCARPDAPAGRQCSEDPSLPSAGESCRQGDSPELTFFSKCQGQLPFYLLRL